MGIKEENRCNINNVGTKIKLLWKKIKRITSHLTKWTESKRELEKAGTRSEAFDNDQWGIIISRIERKREEINERRGVSRILGLEVFDDAPTFVEVEPCLHGHDLHI